MQLLQFLTPNYNHYKINKNEFINLRAMVLIEKIIVHSNYFEAWLFDLFHVLMPS